MSVHILGPGAMGSLVAHELALGSRLVPSLIFKSKSALDSYTNSGGAVTLARPEGTDKVSTSTPIAATSRAHDVQSIENLVVATKNYSTEKALARYLRAMSPKTSILFIQNGMGVIPKLQQAFWPNPREMPRIYKAISTHGAYKANVSTVHHVGLGELFISELPNVHTDPAGLGELPPENALIQALLDRPALAAQHICHQDFLLKEMEKLLVNSCINPLSAIYDCLNGDLFYGDGASRTMQKIILEGVACLRREYAILKSVPEAGTVLAPDRILSLVLSVCQSTAKNSSSMREDMRRMNRTEIDSINGYISYLGRKHNLPTATNNLMVSLIKNKLGIERAQEQLF